MYCTTCHVLPGGNWIKSLYHVCATCIRILGCCLVEHCKCQMLISTLNDHSIDQCRITMYQIFLSSDFIYIYIQCQESHQTTPYGLDCYKFCTLFEVQASCITSVCVASSPFSKSCEKAFRDILPHKLDEPSYTMARKVQFM